MPKHTKRKFRIKHYINHDRYHFGIFYCLDFDMSYSGKRDKYLLIGIGKHDICIGMITEEEWEVESHE